MQTNKPDDLSTCSSGQEFVDWVNEKLEAYDTMNAGDEEPSPTHPMMLWADTTAHVLKIRRSDNTGWIELGRLDESNMFYGDNPHEYIRDESLALRFFIIDV